MESKFYIVVFKVMPEHSWCPNKANHFLYTHIGWRKEIAVYVFGQQQTFFFMGHNLQATFQQVWGQYWKQDAKKLLWIRGSNIAFFKNKGQ